MSLRIRKNKEGSALIFTMFILSGMFLVAIGSSYLVTLGIKAGGIQAQSTKAYFVSESGVERLLWEVRKNGYIPYEDSTPISQPVFHYSPNTNELSLGGDYQVYRQHPSDFLYRSIGGFNNTKRSVEVEF